MIGSPLNLFCHVHVPKTGGTSLNTLLASWFPGAFEVLHYPDPSFVLSIEELASHLARNPSLNCICTHHLRSYPATINGRPVHYFTILREPLDRTISVITFMKGSFHELSEAHKATVPLNFPMMTELDILRLWTPNLSDSKSDSGLPGNPVTALFHQDRGGLDFAKNRRTIEMAVAAKCIAALSRFLYVGDFARFEQSVNELARRIRALGASTCEINHVPVERVSRDTRGDLQWLEKGHRIVEAYMESVMIDGMVYRHFASQRR